MSVTSLSVVLPVLLMFLISLKVGQYFVSLSIFDMIFQTLSTGADISRLTLISSREVAVAVGICHAARAIVAIIVMTTTALSTFSVTSFFIFVVFVSIVKCKRSIFSYNHCLPM